MHFKNSAMESLPHEIIEAILGRLPDVESIASFATTSRKCRDAAARADLIHCLDMPVKSMDQVTHPDNKAYLSRMTPKGYNLCYTCMFCKHIIPTLTLEVMMVCHKCHDATTNFRIVQSANNSRAVLYKSSSTSHLTQPLPCCSDTLRNFSIKPKVYPYA